MRAIADRITRDNTDGVIFFPPIFMPVITVLPWAIACSLDQEMIDLNKVMPAFPRIDLT